LREEGVLMFNLFKNKFIRELGVTDKQLYFILEQARMKRKNKKKAFKGDFCYKNSEFLIYYDSDGNRIYFLKRLPIHDLLIGNKAFNMASSYNAYDTESSNGEYRPFALYSYEHEALTIMDNHAMHIFFLWFKSEFSKVV
jgi:hypothetical protein